VSGSVTLDGDTSSGQLAGKIRSFESNIGGLNHISGKSDFSVGLPTDGSWNLTLNVAGLTKFVGTGIVGLPNQTLGLDLNGNFRNGLLKLQAKGASDVVNAQPGQGLSAKIFLTPSFETLQLEGKLMGQKITFNVSTSPQ
jgi:hypothetical protein